MIDRRRRNRIVFVLCFQAVAVAIICFGSLINFHQYKIWGKPLIPEFVGYKRDNEHNIKQLTPKEDLTTVTGYDELPFYVSGIRSYESPCLLSPRFCLSIFAETPIIPLGFQLTSQGLRAPPIA